MTPVKEIDGVTPDTPADFSPEAAAMETLIPATLFMIASHVVPGVPAIRSSLIDALGRRLFLSTYSAVSIAALVLVVWSYRTADPGLWFYFPTAEAKAFAVLGMPVPCSCWSAG